jgi:hypothetical protein
VSKKRERFAPSEDPSHQRLLTVVDDRFFRQLRFQEFDVSELSMSSYVMTLHQNDPPFIALPVFPSRFFRHQSMYINKNAGISKPEHLKGKKIGIPEYQSELSLSIYVCRRIHDELS